MNATTLISARRINRSDLLESEIESIESTLRSRALKDRVADIAAQSDHLSDRFGKEVRVTVDTTEELKALQEVLGIAEETVRARQQEMGLSRLHPSRRQEFVQEILNEVATVHADAVVAEHREEIEREANRRLDKLANPDTGTQTYKYRTDGKGNFRRFNTTREDEQPDAILTADPAVPHSDTLEQRRTGFVVAIGSGGTIRAETPFGDGELDVEPGFYALSFKSLGAAAEDLGLIEREQRDASATSSDEEALDIIVGRGESEDKAHVIELSNNDGGYSSRYTKGWAEYRDFDPGREMVLITVGQASYYNGSMRGKSERTWLVGKDDGQVWSQQVYNSHTTVEEALEFMRPAEVDRLREKGRRVIRQGDVWFVEMLRSSNFSDIEGSRHDVQETEDGVTIEHPEHPDLELEGKWKALTNNDGSNPGGGTSSRGTVYRD